jgi:predicted ArsR family transcriptional regulator
MGSDTSGLSDLAALSALEDPTRRQLYAAVAAAGRPVGRDEAAAAVGISRSLAAYHLDKLAGHGLLEVGYARLGERSGAGGGRPAKLYRRAAREFVLRAPPRDYRLLAELLVRAAASDENGVVQAALERAAAELGESLGATGDSLEQILRERGYEPADVGPDCIRLRNCPFASVAADCPRVVCAMNLALIRGMLSSLGADPKLATLAPREDSCCVEIARRSAA